MKYLVFILFALLLCVFSAFAQTVNKPKEPVSLIELAKQPICGTQHIAQLEDMVKDQPNNREFQIQRAYCLKLTKDPEFLKMISLIININPKFSSDTYFNLHGFLLSKELLESEGYLSKLSAALPNHWYPFLLQTKLKINQKDYQGALDNWLKAIDLMPLTDTLLMQSINDFTLRQITYEIHRLVKEKDALDFYDRIYNAMHKRQQKLTVKLKELPFNSPEYKKVRDEVKDFGGIAISMCVYWAKLAVKLGNTQMESAVLEKMVTTEPRWAGYSNRSAYYQTNGNPKKAFADQVRSFEMAIELFHEELKQGGTQAEQLNLNNRIANQYSAIGDLYFRDAQYVKALSNYERAKPFSRDQKYVEMKIKAALQKLNVTEEKPKKQGTFNPAIQP